MANLNRKTKDSVFTRLFSEPEYAFQLYQVLHPEDKTSTEQDIKIITIKNIFVNDFYNDLGLLVRNKFILLVEAQSTWNPNMALRTFLYLADTYKRHLLKSDIDLFSPKLISIPKPEVVVIFTGDKKDIPQFQKLSDHFENHNSIKIENSSPLHFSLELSVEIVYNSKVGDIVYQYINFCKIFDDQLNKFPTNKELAIIETIKICKNKNLLEKFIMEHELEVNELMEDFIFDEERLRAIHERNMRRLFEEQDSELRENRKIIEKSKAEIIVISNELETKKSELLATKSELESKQSELETKQSELESKQSELEIKQSELESKQFELESKQSELETKQSELEIKNSRIAELEALVKQLQSA